MREFGPFIGFILLLVLSTAFSRKADQARRRSEEQKQAGAPKPPPGGVPHGDARRVPHPASVPPPMDLGPGTFEEIPFDEVDVGGDDGETRFTDDLADEMLRDNAHLAKQLGTLQRWNRRSSTGAG